MTRRPSRKRRWSMGGAASFRLAMTGGLCGSVWDGEGGCKGVRRVKRRGRFNFYYIGGRARAGGIVISTL